MSLITNMRKQAAIYWPPAGTDDYGKPKQGDLVELVRSDDGNFQVRWEDVSQEFTDTQGTTRTSNALVYVPLLPDGSEVVPGGFLWLGNRSDLVNETNPGKNPGIHEVKRFDKLPTLKATETLRTAYL